MRTSKMCKIVRENMEFINSQCDGGVVIAKNMGTCYNLLLVSGGFAEMEVFEHAFMKWYEVNEEFITSERESGE